MDRALTSRRGYGRRGGFTLVELMIVVVITGILATIAIPTFTGYIYKSRTSEATQILGLIKLRQEAYRSEFGRYAQINGNDALPIPDDDFAPGDAGEMTNSETRPFPGGVHAGDWTQLGVNIGQNVYFGFGVASGTPADPPPTSPDLGLPADHWFVLQAVSDLDGDGTACLFETYSHGKHIYFEPAKGWE